VSYILPYKFCACICWTRNTVIART